MSRTLAYLGSAILAATVGLMWNPVAGSAQDITIVSPFAAGGTSDVIARAVARGMEGALKRTTIVENIVGAGGTIGIANVARAKADGRRLVIAGVGSLVLAAGLYGKSLRYDAQADLEPVALLAEAPTVLVVSKGLQAKTLAELIEHLRRNPGKLSFGSAGVGGSFHLTGELFQKLAGVTINHVPYRGGAPLMTDLVGGHIQMAFADPTLVTEHVASGAGRALVVAAPRRSPALPDVPTSAEAGLPGLELVTWYGLMAAKGTPRHALERLSSAALDVARSPDFQAVLRNQHLDPATLGPAEFRKVIEADFKRWLPVIAELGLKAN